MFDVHVLNVSICSLCPHPKVSRSNTSKNGWLAVLICIKHCTCSDVYNVTIFKKKSDACRVIGYIVFFNNISDRNRFRWARYSRHLFVLCLFLRPYVRRDLACLGRNFKLGGHIFIFLGTNVNIYETDCRAQKIFWYLEKCG